MNEQIRIKRNGMVAGHRLLAATVAITGVLAAVAASLTIPFLYESSSMYYKFGIDKAILRSAKMVGLAAAMLLLLQLILTARLKWLDRIFSLPGLYRTHRINAWVIGALVLVHPMLIFTAEGLWKIPLERRYWPEWVGVFLVMIILIQIGLSRWRKRLFNAYRTWRRYHSILAAAVFIGLFLHILSVSETFELSGPPRLLTLMTAAGIGLLWTWIRTSGLRSSRKPFRVTGVSIAGADAFTVALEPSGQFEFAYLPGQFVLVSFDARHISREFHPFTIATAPTRPDHLQFTIRCCGNWTDRIGTLEPGTPARIQGPYGRFCHLFLHPRREVVMIAGGIGITPMLSMLRYMTDVGDTRRTTLVWSNRTREQLFCGDELEAITQKLTDFRWVPIFTQEKNLDGRHGRLDRSSLEILLKHCSRDAAVFLCGPPAMVGRMRAALKLIGFPKRSIYTEAFGF